MIIYLKKILNIYISANYIIIFKAIVYLISIDIEIHIKITDTFEQSCINPYLNGSFVVV